MANFKNTSRSAEEETTGNFCGNTNIGEEEVTLELSEEEKDQVAYEHAAVSSRLRRYKEMKSSNRTLLTEPYISPADDELIYIPLVFHQFQDNTEWPDNTMPSGFTASTCPASFYVEVVELLNQFMEGTYVNTNGEGTIGAHRLHPDHGVVSKIRYKIAPQIPGKFLSEFLNIKYSHNAEPEGYLKGLSGFYYTDDILTSAETLANENLLAAEGLKDARYTSLIEEGSTPSEADVLILSTAEYQSVLDMLYIKSLGGLVECGTDGAIFTYNIDNLDTCKTGILHELSNADYFGNSDAVEGICDLVACTDNISSIGCTLNANVPLGQVSGVRGTYDGIQTAWSHAYEMGNWGNTLPVMNVWNTLGDLSITTVSWRGLGPSPNLVMHGNVYMNDSGSFDRDAAFYAGILLHELGHSYGLPHTFQGGSIQNLKNVVAPPFKFPIEDYTDITTGYVHYMSPLRILGEGGVFFDQQNFIMSLFTVSEDITLDDLNVQVHYGLTSTADVSTIITIPISKLQGFEGEGMHIAVRNAINTYISDPTGGIPEYTLFNASVMTSVSGLPGSTVMIPAGSNIDTQVDNIYSERVLRLGWYGDYPTADSLVVPILSTVIEEQVSFNISTASSSGVSGDRTLTIEAEVDGVYVLLQEFVIPINYSGVTSSVDISAILTVGEIEAMTAIKITTDWPIGVNGIFVGTSIADVVVDVVVDDSGMDLPSDEAIFVDMFFNKILEAIDTTSKTGFEVITEGGVLIKNFNVLENGLGARQTISRINIWEQTLNMPSFWGGSVDESQLTSDGNASLVFNKVITDTHQVNLEGLTIVNPITDAASYYDTDSGYLVLKTNGSSANSTSAWENVTLVESDLGVARPGRMLVVETLQAQRTIAVTQHFEGGGTTTELLISEIYANPMTFELELAEQTVEVVLSVQESTYTGPTLETIITSISTVSEYRPVNVKTKVPFCVPNADGTLSDVFDDFWHINFNWLDENYPDYPDNWSTDKAYNQFLDDGITPLCPCLYATQNYVLNGDSYYSTVPAEDTDSLLASISYIDEYQQYFSSGYLSGTLYSGSPRVTFDGGSLQTDNGHTPLFGYYGYGALQGMPGRFRLDFNKDTLDFYNLDDLLSDTPRFITKGISSYTELLSRVGLGSSNASDIDYNPFKIDVPSEVNHPARFSMDTVLTENSSTNPFYGAQLPIGRFDLNFILHAMNYSRYTFELTDGSFSSGISTLFTSGTNSGYQYAVYTRLSLFSPEGVFRTEVMLDTSRGKWGEIQKFSRITDVRNTYSSSEDAHNILSDIEQYVVDFDPEAMGLYGCMDVAALNYDPEALSSSGDCQYAGDPECVMPIEIIDVCIDAQSIQVCSQIDEDILNAFLPGESISQIVSTEEYPIYEGCAGGGVQYSINTDECVYGTLEVTGCLVPESITQEEIEALGPENYTLICPDSTRHVLYSDMYTLGGTYFNSEGESYSGVYCYRSDNVTYSGSLKLSGERLYTRDQLSKSTIVLDPLEKEAKKFDKIRKNIENICKFVKL